MFSLRFCNILISLLFIIYQFYIKIRIGTGLQHQPPRLIAIIKEAKGYSNDGIPYIIKFITYRLSSNTIHALITIMNIR